MKNEEYPKTDFRFREFLRDEDGRLVRLETVESAIPVNVFADDGSDFDLREGELCSAELIGDAYELKVYKDEAAFRASGTAFAPESMVPCGTFPPNDDVKDFRQSPRVVFSGSVVDAIADPAAASDEPNCYVTVKTCEMTVTVVARYDGEISPGCVLRGVAWLYGDIRRKAEDRTARL